MLRLMGGVIHPGADLSGETKSQATLSLARLIQILRRQWPILVACVTLGAMLAIAYTATATSRYTAGVKLMIDTRRNTGLRRQEFMGDQQLEAGFVDSQVEILRSESLARSVVRELDLLSDPEFTRPASGGLVGSLVGLVTGGVGSASASEAARERSAIRTFTRNVTAKRVGLTYVIEVEFTCEAPDKAARIANAIADAYMVGELDARFQSTRRASRWLQERIAELRTQATRTDSAVQAFKAENNIVDTSRGLMNEQQLSDVNTQLIQARALTAETKARLDRINEVSGADLPDASVSDALRSDVINRARAQYLDAARREADWSNRYGANHAAAVNLRVQMTELKRAIKDELTRIAQSYQSDFQIAKARETSIEKSLDELVTKAGTTSQAQVKLRELESSAQTYRSLYDSFLQKFEEATQQQSFPITDARVIAPATEPITRSAPRALLAIPGGVLAGLALGMAIAASREMLSNVFRTADELEPETGLDYLGTLPHLERAAVGLRDAKSNAAGLMRFVVGAPFSRYAEVLRNVKVSLDVVRLTREVKVIGLVSALPREGKTTIASNLSLLIARSGHRVLLIDGDLRNPSLTRSLAPSPGGSLLEVLDRTRPLAEAVRRDPDTSLDFLPATLSERLANTAELLASDAMAKFLAEARDVYDYVIVDLPPLMPVVDAKACASLIDGFIYVVRWGVTARTAVTEALAGAQLVRDRTVGILLNDADPSALKRIEYHKGPHYGSYYHSET